MKFEWYLALRYFRGKRKGSGFLSFIKYMSIAGVAIGSAGLLIALSIVHGFKSTIYGKVFDFAPHVSVTAFTEAPLNRADTMYTHLQQYPEIESSRLVASGQVMIQTKDQVTGTILKGIGGDGNAAELRDFLDKGTLRLAKKQSGLPGIIIGSGLARQLAADTGDVLTVYTINGVPSMLKSPEIQQFRLSGIYTTGMAEFDESIAISDISYARRLFSMNERQATSIELRLKDTDQIETFSEKLNEYLTIPYFVETIYMIFGNIFAWVNLQEDMIPVVISGMIIVAAFNLIGTILMMVLERTRDIGILKTIGSKSSLIRRIFLLEGLMVAATGLIFGIGISLLFNYLQMEYKIIPLSQENYYMSYAPVEPHALDFLLVTVVTFFLCGLASWLPARVASNTDPVKVIAYGK